MSNRNIINNLSTSFSLEYYVEDAQGNPSLDKKLTVGAGSQQKLDQLVNTCWLKFIVPNKDGCTVTLKGNQILELITVKSVSSGGSNTETVVKIAANTEIESADSNGEDDDVVVDPAYSEP